MRDRWFIMYGGEKDGSAFKAWLRSSARYLDSYFEQLGEATGENGTKKVIRSILLEHVYTCINATVKSG